MRVALVVMPFAAADRPSLAAGLFKASLHERGIPCDCKYFNLTLCSLLGRDPYAKASLHTTGSLAGEWVFSQIYFGESFSSWESYRDEILDHPVWGIEEDHQQDVQRLRKIAPLFLRIAYESCDWSRYDLVGFTSDFEQTMPGLCLARMIRQNHPQVKIAFGGTNFEGPMARPYFDLFQEIDYISTGEADISFPQLCVNLARGCTSVPEGFLHRGPQAGPCQGDNPGHATLLLDQLPVPDYDDFFSAVVNAPTASGPLYVLMEASRGCWWGQRQHCTFCAFSRETISFRFKRWQRVIEEASFLQERYRPDCLFFTDSILAMDYFDTLLPHWAQTRSQTPKFFEIKANLKREHLEMLRKAGVLYVQPGIESLADRTLELMKKGVSAAQNVALLRWCRELGIRVHWNVLFGFPQEDLDDFPVIHEAMSQIVHLQAPEVCGPIRLDRFSPNYNQWREKGFTEIEPLPAYRHIYPLDDGRLRDLAYYFHYQHDHSVHILDLGKEILDLGRVWRKRCEDGTNGIFSVKRHLDGGWILVDSRFNRPKTHHRVNRDDLLLLLLCDAPTTEEALFETAQRRRCGSGSSIADAYERLRGWGAIGRIGRRIVALPLLPDDLRNDPSMKGDHDG